MSQERRLPRLKDSIMDQVAVSRGDGETKFYEPIDQMVTFGGGEVGSAGAKCGNGRVFETGSSHCSIQRKLWSWNEVLDSSGQEKVTVENLRGAQRVTPVKEVPANNLAMDSFKMDSTYRGEDELYVKIIRDNMSETRRR